MLFEKVITLNYRLNKKSVLFIAADVLLVIIAILLIYFFIFDKPTHKIQYVQCDTVSAGDANTNYYIAQASFVPKIYNLSKSVATSGQFNYETDTILGKLSQKIGCMGIRGSSGISSKYNVIRFYLAGDISPQSARELQLELIKDLKATHDFSKIVEINPPKVVPLVV
jgi:hypothetical protein